MFRIGQSAAKINKNKIMKLKIKAKIKINFYGRKSIEKLEIIIKVNNLAKKSIEELFIEEYEYATNLKSIISINKVQRLSKHT
jgi:hypothetical protein